MKIVLTKPFLPEYQRMIVTYPLGLLYLGSYLKKHLPEIKVNIVDPDIYTGDFESFIKIIKLHNPDIVCISVFSHVVTHTRQMIEALKNVLPTSIVIAGGSHINAVKEDVLHHLQDVDYAIYGEGEKGLLSFCREFLRIGNLLHPEQIPGLVYRSNSRINSIVNSFTEDLGEFDPIDYSMINIHSYFRRGSPMGLFRRGNCVAQIITTRGCPFSCTFCASPVNMGRNVRKRSTSGIINEIETLISLGADEIHVMDDNFTFDKGHVINLCKEIVKKRINIWVAMPNGVRLDRIDEEMLKWMKKAGWYHLGFGIEVGSDKALKIVRKGMNMSQVKEKITLVKKAGFSTTGFFLLGLPHDDINSLKETAACPDRLGLDMASFGNFTPLPGTHLYNELIERGEIERGFLPSFSSGEVTYSPRTMSHQQLARFQRNFTFRYWLNPRRIKLILTRLKPRDLRYVFRRLFLLVFRPT